jgi:hypothetical protein
MARLIVFNPMTNFPFEELNCNFVLGATAPGVCALGGCSASMA